MALSRGKEKSVSHVVFVSTRRVKSFSRIVGAISLLSFSLSAVQMNRNERKRGRERGREAESAGGHSTCFRSYLSVSTPQTRGGGVCTAEFVQ